jgi:hypothetical protein
MFESHYDLTDRIQLPVFGILEQLEAQEQAGRHAITTRFRR